MVIIRKGKIRDCKDLLTVYQTTRWFYRTIPDGFKTVEQIKKEHKSVGFKNWGWLVAEVDNTVVGEIVFRIEKNPTSGRLGIIRNLDVDVRYQKKGIGTKLTLECEQILKDRRALRVVTTTPPEAYNYWMKIAYFARGSLLTISSPITKIPKIKPRRIKTTELKKVTKLPKSTAFSNFAIPGAMVEMISEIVDYKTKGRLFEFHLDDKLLGSGVIIRRDDGLANFIVDATKAGSKHLDYIVSKTASAASRWKCTRISSTIPKDKLSLYDNIQKWSIETARAIPVTKLLS